LTCTVVSPLPPGRRKLHSGRQGRSVICGRYALYPSIDSLLDIFRAAGSLLLEPRWNIPPTAQVPVIVQHRETGERIVELARWGLEPPGAPRTYHIARGETVARLAPFRRAFKRSRCLIPMSGFYEWQESVQPKQPWYVTPIDAPLFAAAGLLEFARRADGWLITACIITTGPNDTMRPIHDRMPVMLEPADWDAWLDRQNEDIEALQRLLRPAPDGSLQVHRVGLRVNNARIDDVALIEPLE